MSEFKDRLKEIVNKFGSVRALGEAVGLSPPGIAKYFRSSQPTMDKLIALAKAGGVSVEWLATGTDPNKDKVTIERVGDIMSIVDDHLTSLNRQLPDDKKRELIVYLLHEPGLKTRDSIKDQLNRLLRLIGKA